MLSVLSNWHGCVDIDGAIYNSPMDIPSTIDWGKVGSISLKPRNAILEPNKSVSDNPISTVEDTVEYVFTVKAYMCKRATLEFDFMAKWNKDVPMPLRTMVGTIEKETRGMMYVKLHGDIIAKTVPTCMCCGRPLTNPVSQYFGMGPECGGHNYTNPFDSDEELQKAVESYKEQLHSINWEGWLIKSAIVEQKVFDKQ